MAGPNIPAAKRAGLPVDLARLTAEGDGWLTPEDRYALKTHGVCTQLQDEVFMVRVRIPGGVAPTGQVRGLARVAARHAEDWLHVTTRQNVELHWVRDRDVEGVLGALARHGLSTRSACGHTVRNVMCSEDAGVGLDEPFDCFPDARQVSDALDRPVGRAERRAALPPQRGARRLAPLPPRRPGQRRRAHLDRRRRRAGLRDVGRRQPRQGAVAGGAAAPRSCPAPTCSPRSRPWSTCSSPTVASTSRPRAA